MARLLTAALVFALLPLLAAFQLDERHSGPYRYLQAHERPHSAASCRGRLGLLETHTPQWQLELILVGYIPELDGAGFKQRMQEQLARAGYDTVLRSHDPHGEDWLLHVKHRLRGDERILYVRHDRSGLRTSLWCYLSVDYEGDARTVQSPLEACLAPGRSQKGLCW